MVFHWVRMEEEEMLELNESSSEMSVRMEELLFSSLGGEEADRFSGWEGRGVSSEEGEDRFLEWDGVMGVMGVIGVMGVTGVTDLTGFTGVTGSTETDDFIDFVDFVDFTNSLSKKEGMGVTTDATCMRVLLASTADRNTSWKATNNTSSLNSRICFLSVLRLMS